MQDDLKERMGIVVRIASDPFQGAGLAFSEEDLSIEGQSRLKRNTNIKRAELLMIYLSEMGLQIISATEDVAMPSKKLFGPKGKLP